MEKINITWLNSCPVCDSNDLTVHTEKGNPLWLYEGDLVECSCGEKGHIEVVDVEVVEVIWESEDEED